MVAVFMLRSIVLILAIVTATTALTFTSGAVLPADGEPGSETSARAVRGELIAVNVKDSPHVVVIRAMTASKKELIVGATVDSSTSVTRAGRRARLQDLKVGEPVVITYTKQPQGLVAHSIEAR
jgi:hypothetical protein